MRLFLRKYVAALGLCSLLMVTYCLLVVPAIEPPDRPPVERPEFQPVTANARWWDSFFEEGSWQRDNPTVVRNKRGVLLAKTWEQTGPKTWKLKPLAMVLPTSSKDPMLDPNLVNFNPQLVKDSSGGEMWIVSANEGAVIDFEEPFDLKSGRVPPVERGQLNGEITITKRSLSNEPSDPWELRTSNLAIDRRLISTQQSVTLTWPGSVIRGSNLRIMLRRGVLGGAANDDGESPWGPLDEMELYQVEDIRVALPNGGLWADVDDSMFDLPAALRSAPAYLTAACGGRFSFNFSDSEATLTNGVQIRHFLANEAPDEFSSHRVSVKVRPPNEQRSSPNSRKFAGIDVKQLTALGIDSLQNFVGEKWVELNAPTIDSAAQAKKLVIDFDEQKVELAGRLDQPKATQSIAWLRYQEYEFRAPKLEYKAAREHLGWMVASGPGELTADADSEMGAVHVRWDNALNMAPTQVPGEHWLELVGKTLVESQQHGFLTTDQYLRIWLKDNENAQTNSTGHRSLTSQPLLPDRIAAAGNTKITTNDLRANVEELQLKLQYVFDAAPQPQSPPLAQVVVQPDASLQPAVDPPVNPKASLVTNPVSENRAEPIEVIGNKLVGKLTSSADQQWIEDLVISGPLKILRSQSKVPSKERFPWNVDGEQLRMSTNPDGKIDLSISGSPAKVHMAEGSLQGPEIRFDQQNSLIFLEHPGEFTIPASLLNKQPGSVRWLQAPHFTWKGHLVFDGAVIRIVGDIEFDGAFAQGNDLFRIQGFCDRINLELDEAIDLRGDTSKTLEASLTKVKQIVLLEKIDIRVSQTDLQHNRKSLERIILPTSSLTFRVAEREVVALGPGTVQSKFPSENKLAESTVTNAEELMGAQLAFRDSMVCYLDQKEVVFEGQVQMFVSNLMSWQDELDLRSIQALKMGELLLNCDQLKAYSVADLSSTVAYLSDGQKQDAWEFQALGNVLFEGQADSGHYTGGGYRATYKHLFDQLIVQGDGRTPAQVVREPNGVGQQAATTAFDLLKLNVKTMEIQKLDLSGFEVDMTPQPTPKLRSSGPQLPPLQPLNSNEAPVLDPRSGVSKFFERK